MAYISENILLGAHTSTSGGLDRAIIRGNKLKCSSIQIFTKNQLRWNSHPIDEDQLQLFKKRYSEVQSLKRVVAHSSYLINLASNDRELANKSRMAASLEIERSIQLGIPLYVLHPGFHRGMGVKAGINNIVLHLKELTSEYGDKIIICIETMAGQGSSLGSSFDEISEIIYRVGRRGIGVCFDTCHVFSSGYDIRDEESYLHTMNEFNRLIGIDKLKVIHLNDSKGELGSGVDRHMHIGRGNIGIKAFSLIMNDSRFQGIPKIIETPKEKNPEKYDAKNLELLRSLVDG